jgi:hypothetical protein
MKTARTALLAAVGLIASTLVAGAQVGDFSAAPVAASEPSARPADATAVIHALVRDASIVGQPGLSENAYDFNAPGGVPGFGPIDSVPGDRRFAHVIIWE